MLWVYGHYAFFTFSVHGSTLDSKIGPALKWLNNKNIYLWSVELLVKTLF